MSFSKFFDQFKAPYVNNDYIVRRRADSFLMINLILVFVLPCTLLIYLIWLPERLFIAAPALLAGLLNGVVNLILVKKGRLRLASLLFSFFFAFIIISAQMFKLLGDFHTAYNSFIYFFIVPILVTALFNELKFIVPIAALMCFANIVFYVLIYDKLKGNEIVSAQIGFISSLQILVMGSGIIYQMKKIMEGALIDVQKTNASLSRFVPFEFLFLLQKHSITDINIGDNRVMKLTILFSDLRNFTAISEKNETEEIFNILNSYLAVMGPIVSKHGGFIDKYIGDAIMALFTDADGAIEASIEMLSALPTLQENIHKDLNFGIGINTGEVTLGAIGEQNRLETTVISDAVNTASRLESMTKKVKIPLLISGNTVRAIREEHPLKRLGKLKVKGKDETVEVYTSEMFISERT